MMNLRDIADACSALGNQLAAGIPVSDAAGRMAELQPKHSTVWKQAAQNASRGVPLSESLKDIWPVVFVTALRGGEEAGETHTICHGIEEAIESRMSAFGVLNKLLYPGGILIAGLAVSMFFLGFVIPILVKNIMMARPGADSEMSLILRFGVWLNHAVVDYWFIASLIVGGLALLVAYLWVSGKAASLMQSFLLRTPAIAPHASAIFYATWAKTVALMTGAGLPVTQAIAMSVQGVPPPLQASVRMILHALENSLPLGQVIKPTMAGDDREKLPFYIANAFRIAEQTGRLDLELNRAAPILIRDATRKIEFLSHYAMAFSMAVSGMLLVTPLGAYYTELFGVIKKIM